MKELMELVLADPKSREAMAQAMRDIPLLNKEVRKIVAAH